MGSCSYLKCIGFVKRQFGLSDLAHAHVTGRPAQKSVALFRSLRQPSLAQFLARRLGEEPGLTMSNKSRSHLDWMLRPDGSRWAQCKIGGETAVVALTEEGAGKISATAIVDVDFISVIPSIDDAQQACENWLLEIGATPGHRSAISRIAGSAKKSS